MKLVLVTPPTPHPHEIEILNVACELGVDRIHIRKPHTHGKEEQLKTYLEALEENIIKISALHYYENLVQKYLIPVFHLSSNLRKKILDEDNNITKNRSYQISTSFHHPNEITTEGKSFDYAFCSPIYPSISKKGYSPNLNWNLDQYNLPTVNYPELIALGGIDSNKVEDCKNRGFVGVAVLGSIWNKKTKEESIRELEKIKAECVHLS